MGTGSTRALGLLAVAALSIAKASPARAQTADAPRPEKVRLQLSYEPQFQFAGYLVALDHGYYAAEGLDVTIEPAHGPSPQPIDVVLAGDAEFGTCESEIAIARNAGKPVVLLASIFQHSACCLVARRDSG